MGSLKSSAKWNEGKREEEIDMLLGKTQHLSERLEPLPPNLPYAPFKLTLRAGQGGIDQTMEERREAAAAAATVERMMESKIVADDGHKRAGENKSNKANFVTDPNKNMSYSAQKGEACLDYLRIALCVIRGYFQTLMLNYAVVIQNLKA